MSEMRIVFPTCGGRGAVLVGGGRGADRAAHDVRRLLASWERRLTRFDPLSELARLNASRATHVRASDLMCRFASAAVDGAAATGGLVDPTLIGEIEAVGYTSGRRGGLPLELALKLAPPRSPGGANSAARWTRIKVDHERGVITRPHGVQLDSGGIAKGLFADLAADMLAGFGSWTVDVCGDLRIGGTAHRPRRVRVANPFTDGDVLHELAITEGGVATSGIGRRAWLGSDGKPAHHLLDPATGKPAYTGVVQATAVAPTAVEAEALAKAALLDGPHGAHRWLPHGGVLVYDDGSHAVIANPAQGAGSVAVAA